MLEKLSQAQLPPNVDAVLGPDYSPVGKIYFYTLLSSNPAYDLMELETIQMWFVEKQFKSVANVADVSSLGGLTREFQVRLNPERVVESSGMGKVINVNAGGSFRACCNSCSASVPRTRTGALSLDSTIAIFS